MKPILVLAIALSMGSCATTREFQADVTDATLVKIDVITRYPDKKLKMLTWRTDDNVNYITYESIYSDVTIGDMMKVLTKR